MESKISQFINGGGVIQVNNADEMKMFVKALKKYGIYESLIGNKMYADKYEKISFYRDIAKLNNGGQWLRPDIPIYFEYQYGKGITFYWKYSEVLSWYGPDSVIKVSEI